MSEQQTITLSFCNETKRVMCTVNTSNAIDITTQFAQLCTQSMRLGERPYIFVQNNQLLALSVNSANAKSVDLEARILTYIRQLCEPVRSQTIAIAFDISLDAASAVIDDLHHKKLLQKMDESSLYYAASN